MCSWRCEQGSVAAFRGVVNKAVLQGVHGIVNKAVLQRVVAL